MWQKHAESQSAGLLLRMGRQTEFIVRRCFLPYFLLVVAALNRMDALVYMTAFGANVAWIVSLSSLIAFSERGKFAGEGLGSSAADRKPVIVKA